MYIIFFKSNGGGRTLLQAVGHAKRRRHLTYDLKFVNLLP